MSYPTYSVTFLHIANGLTYDIELGYEWDASTGVNDCHVHAVNGRAINKSEQDDYALDDQFMFELCKADMDKELTGVRLFI